MSKNYVIGVDVGGTFTDFVMFDHATNALFFDKLLTTPDDPSIAVLEGVSRIISNNGIEPSDVRNVIHGTTLVANALIERRGSETALVTTEGFRDLLELGRENRYDTYDLFIELPKPIVERAQRYEVRERLDSAGNVVVALDEGMARDVARSIAGTDAKAIAVAFLHSFTNPVHEERMLEILREELPDVTICISSEVAPLIGEYERSSTTVANAYVQPIFHNYVERLSGGLKALGIERDLYLVLSDGGTVDTAAAIASPIRLIHSGPAGGAQAAALFGQASQLDRVLCFDMGGTTAKACLIEDNRPNRTTEVEVARMARFKAGSGLPLRVPIVNMIEIGAGGGSIAGIDGMGLIQVGPRSASSKPGPACYGLGGQDPTVTDADLVLGYLDKASFLGGEMTLDLDGARAAIDRVLAGPLGIGIEEAALGLCETVNANMAQATTIHALEQGKRLADFTLIPIGGAGPVHACGLARKAGIPNVLCPLGPGVASAMGFLSAPTSFEFVRTLTLPVEGGDYTPAIEMLHGMHAEGVKLLEAAGIAATDIRHQIVCGLRYAGQGYEVETNLTLDDLIAGGATRIRKAFERNYHILYGRIEEGIPVEMTAWRMTVSGPLSDLRPRVPVGASEVPFEKGSRPVYFAETRSFIETPVYNRYKTIPGTVLSGPAIFEERESTFVVPPDSRVEIDAALGIKVSL